MTTIGFCTQLCQADEWAFTYAFELVQRHGWQLNICHWLNSPYRVRRDIVPDDLFQPQQAVQVTPQLLAHLDFQLRQYYDARLGNFTNVAFKLCEGDFQVEMVRCFRQHLLDLVVMGYRTPEELAESEGWTLEEFAARLPHPLVIVGRDGPESFLLNAPALDWLEKLALPEGKWQALGVAAV